MKLILTVVITSVVAYVVIGWAGPMGGEYNSAEGYEAQTSWLVRQSLASLTKPSDSKDTPDLS